MSAWSALLDLPDSRLNIILRELLTTHGYAHDGFRQNGSEIWKKDGESNFFCYPNASKKQALECFDRLRWLTEELPLQRAREVAWASEEAARIAHKKADAAITLTKQKEAWGLTDITEIEARAQAMEVRENELRRLSRQMTSRPLGAPGKR